MPGPDPEIHRMAYPHGCEDRTCPICWPHGHPSEPPLEPDEENGKPKEPA